MKRLCLSILLFTLLLPSFALSEVLTGKVISIADGDTLTILDSSKQQHKVRLYGIDCPEKGQAFGNSAKKLTAKLTANKTAHVVKIDTDRYGRSVGVVVVNGVNVNQSLIEAGYAWQYRKYCKESFCDDWLKLEQKAKYLKIGLWADSGATAPWQWRKAKRSYAANSNPKRTNNNNTSVLYHGNIRSHAFHGPSCRHYNCKNCVKDFKSKKAALNSGYHPHNECVD